MVDSPFSTSARTGRIRMSQYKIRSKYYHYVLFTFFFLGTFLLVNTNASSDPDATFNYDQINHTIFAGNTNILIFEIENTGESDLFYNLTYSSNLLVDENTVGFWDFNHISGNSEVS